VRKAILGVQTDVGVPIESAREWFLSLQDHPDRYAFETHEGFEFEEGGFGEVGARFKTRERFLFVKVALLFELKDVRQRAFLFRLIQPSFLGIWGRFQIEQDDGQSCLVLAIGSETRVGQLMLRCYPVAAVIHRQIRAEVHHIKQSMERVYDDGGYQSEISR
jgi:hypothetical protein